MIKNYLKFCRKWIYCNDLWPISCRDKVSFDNDDGDDDDGDDDDDDDDKGDTYNCLSANNLWLANDNANDLLALLILI